MQNPLKPGQEQSCGAAALSEDPTGTVVVQPKPLGDGPAFVHRSLEACQVETREPAGVLLGAARMRHEPTSWFQSYHRHPKSFASVDDFRPTHSSRHTAPDFRDSEWMVGDSNLCRHFALHGAGTGTGGRQTEAQIAITGGRPAVEMHFWFISNLIYNQGWPCPVPCRRRVEIQRQIV